MFCYLITYEDSDSWYTLNYHISKWSTLVTRLSFQISVRLSFFFLILANEATQKTFSNRVYVSTTNESSDQFTESELIQQVLYHYQ